MIIVGVNGGRKLGFKNYYVAGHDWFGGGYVMVLAGISYNGSLDLCHNEGGLLQVSVTRIPSLNL